MVLRIFHSHPHRTLVEGPIVLDDSSQGSVHPFRYFGMSFDVHVLMNLGVPGLPSVLGDRHNF